MYRNRIIDLQIQRAAASYCMVCYCFSPLCGCCHYPYNNIIKETAAWGCTEKTAFLIWQKSTQFSVMHKYPYNRFEITVQIGSYQKNIYTAIHPEHHNNDCAETSVHTHSVKILHINGKAEGKYIPAYGSKCCPGNLITHF